MEMDRCSKKNCLSTSPPLEVSLQRIKRRSHCRIPPEEILREPVACGWNAVKHMCASGVFHP